MSKLGKFLGKAEEIEIQGEKLMLYPLTVKDLELFVGKQDASPEEQMKVNREIIKKSLKDEAITDEEIEGMNTDAFIKLMDAISKINGFEDERIKQIKEKIAKGGGK